MIESSVYKQKPGTSDGEHHAIARTPTGITAFVGRTLKGPVNRPLVIRSIADFHQIFGGLWQPSTLSYAIEHFFENGGRKAIVVRVVNGARPPTLTLPTDSGQLRLIGVNPGSREYLRASVDYDGIVESEPDRFNLVVQRVRSSGSEQIQDQETFRRVSVEPGSARFVADVLLESSIVRAIGSVPAERPERTRRTSYGPAVGYINSNSDGDDGAPLTDYDVIGSANEATGLFALQAADGFDLLCIPPLTRELDVGVSTLLVAARVCREQHAMLVVDPPSRWHSAVAALEDLRTWPFRNENAVMYFPRLFAFDRLRNRTETFGSAAAAAGMIARCDEHWPVWSAAEGDTGILRPGLRLAMPVTESEQARLARASVNTLQPVRLSTSAHTSPCTLAAGRSCAPEWKYLTARRLALFIMSSIERGTRWLSFKQSQTPAWERAQAQVEAFLDALDQDGAFAGSRPEESYFVICDERVNPAASLVEGKVNLLFGFAAVRPADFHTCMVTHQAGSSRVRPVTVNRLTTSQQRVEWEIETSILRS